MRCVHCATIALFMVLFGFGPTFAQSHPTREVYVPISEFQALIEDRPDVVVMPLSE